MALTAYLSIKASKQGTIKGSVNSKGHEGQIAVVAFHHEVISPRDAATGLPTGKRMHKPLTITKEIDRSTPPLLAALVANELLNEVILTFFTPNANGVETLWYTIKLTNATIASIEQDMSLILTEPGNKLPLLEQVTFTYQKIEWTWNPGNETASDNWQAANG